MKHGRTGSNTTVCGECGDVIHWDFETETWLHERDGKEECIDTGRNDEPIG